MFTLENTDGFSQSQLNELNRALKALVSEGWEEKAASDRLNNEWRPGVETADELLAVIKTA